MHGPGYSVSAKQIKNMAAILRWTRTVSIRRLHKLSEASKSTATAPLADNESTVPKPFSEMPGESSQS